MKPRFDRAFGHAKNIRNLGCAELFLIAKRQNGPVGSRQTCQRLADIFATLPRTISLVRRTAQVFLECGFQPPAARLTTDPIAALVAYNRISPGVKPGHIVQSTQAAHHGQPSLLKHIVGRIFIADQPPGMTPKRGLPSVHQCGKRIGITLLGLKYQQFVFDPLRLTHSTACKSPKVAVWFNNVKK